MFSLAEKFLCGSMSNNIMSVSGTGVYSKICHKGLFKNRQNKDLNDKL